MQVQPRLDKAIFYRCTWPWYAADCLAADGPARLHIVSARFKYNKSDARKSTAQGWHAFVLPLWSLRLGHITCVSPTPSKEGEMDAKQQHMRQLADRD